MHRSLPVILLTLASLPSGHACDRSEAPWPYVFHAGPAVFRPSGFFETIGMYRSETTGDSVNTRFGQIPLRETPAESLVSAGHSRMQMCGQIGGLSGYVETDFLNAPGKEPYRFRQYWGEYRTGKWRIMAGQAWSLLRPNRVGINSESALMNTLVVEPAYHVGLAGVRNRLVRITRDEGNWRYAVSYEHGRVFLAKAAHDSPRLHLEWMGMESAHRRGVGFAAVAHATRKIDIVSEEVLAYGMGPELLSAIPGGVASHAIIEGVEVRVRPTLELFAYGGIFYGGRSQGNRTVRQWTAGFLRHLFQQGPWGAAYVAGQYSQVDRSTWTGGHGELNYLQMSFRYSLPASRSMFASAWTRPNTRP